MIGGVLEPRLRVPAGMRIGFGRANKALTLALVVIWVLFLRPTFLGGPATYVLVSGTSMEPALSSGDLVLTARKAAYVRGDVIVYRIPADQPGAGALVIHRVIGGSTTAGYVTRGDNRESKDPWRPKAEDISGATRLHVPRIGLLFSFLQTTTGLAFVAGFVTFLVARGSKREPDAS